MDERDGRHAPVATEGADELRERAAPADQLYLDSIRTEGGETVITAHGAEQTLALMALSMRTFFEANSDDDTNYVQSGVLHEGKTWNFVVYPAGKPTPHDLRRRAEAERDALLAKVQAVEALHKAWEDETRDWYYENRHTHENGIEYVAGYEDGWNYADEQLRRALDGPR